MHGSRVQRMNNDNKTKTKIGGLKNDCSLFSKLYIATCEHRAGDLDSFFAHENHACPPALSSMGKLRSGTKSDLLKSIIGICDTATVQNAPQVSAKILDGPALVHVLNPAQTRTFGEYADKVFLPFLCNELNKDTVERVDVVWDTYQAGSLKNTTREKRGSGQRTRVTAGTKLPKGWSNFLKVDTNKEELFHLLSTIGHSHNFENGKEVCFTDGEAILTNVTRETQHLSPCNHEEADSRMMVHVSDAVTQGHKKIMLRTVDTDVVVLAVAQIQKLPELKELWVHIGTGKHHQYVGCHNIANTLGPQRTRVWPLFHALTGCDTVSSFNGKGKKSAFEAWEAFPDLTEGLQFAYEGRIDDAMAIVENYVVILYDSNCKNHRFNEDDHSQSSDEKMDTGSESFKSQDTPNSTLSSDLDDKSIENVLRLQNPEEVLRLSEPVDNRHRPVENLTDSFVSKMSSLNLNSPKENRPKNLGISPPKFSSTLVLTTSHPLMGLSPDDFPDLIPKKIPNDESKDLSLSSIDDDRQNETNGYDFYSPQLNTSKNNLYFSENFTTAESHILNDTNTKFDNIPPDVARVEKERRKIIPRFETETPQRILGRIVDEDKDDSAIPKYIDEMKKSSQSTPKMNFSENVNIPVAEYHSGVAEWCESPSHLRSIPNFELPIELSSNITVNNDLDSPDVISSSTQEDKSLYQALLDPYTGSVALRHTSHTSRHANTSALRRKIQLPPEEDRCSLDSVSVSMDSEEEPPEPEPNQPSDDEDTKRSKSTNTMSDCSDAIPEYSAADELRDERSWLTVHSGGNNVTCDMKVIEPYKRVISHGGYSGRVAVLVFSACHLPDRTRPDYTYVMDNLFAYVIWTLDRLVTDEYVLVYLHGSAGSRRLPTIRWLQECYKLIDRRLRKSLKHLYLVHPTFWLKSFVILSKPFVSSKFSRKLTYVNSLEELNHMVPVDPNAIPEVVKQYDATRR